VRVEAIVTSLVFEHALRIRLKAQLPDAPATPAADAEPVGLIAGADTQTAEATLAMEEGNEAAPVAEARGDAASGHSQGATAVSVASTSASTVVGSPTSAKGKDTKGKKDKKDAKAKKDKNADNLLGRLNNLVTSDLQNVTNGRDFLFVFLNAPINFGLGIAYADPRHMSAL
jgi:hypothetical protein